MSCRDIRLATPAALSPPYGRDDSYTDSTDIENFVCSYLKKKSSYVSGDEDIVMMIIMTTPTTMILMIYMMIIIRPMMNIML